MTSTRNINTPNDYCIQQRQFSHNLQYNLYVNSQGGVPCTPAFPAAGSAPPSLMWRDSLSNNPIEIENSLFGIGSSNLVKPLPKITPQLKTLPTIKYFERNAIVMPEPLVIETNERPLPIP